MNAERAAARRASVFAAVAYLVLAVVMTWPLTRGLGRDVPGDFGDPLLNMWILSWDAEQLRAILGGDLARVRTFFDANMFHPAPLTLAYSEHLFPQAVQSLPVYLATRNPILVYNLLFLSTFVLSGLGCFLLVREITSSAKAGFIAGLLFAFAPYRFTQAPHLQVLSAQWMPFALYGFRRYFAGGNRWALAGAATAIILQNLSCGYFLMYFAPIAIGYALWEIAGRKLWRSRRTWIDLIVAASIVLAATLPFLWPYKSVRESLQLSRDLTEVIRYSADVYSYFTAATNNAVWGEAMRAFPRPEGELFPGLVPLLLGGLAMMILAARVAAVASTDARGRLPNAFAVLLAVAALAYAAVALFAIFSRRVDVNVLGLPLRATDVTRLLLTSVGASVALLWLFPRARARALVALREPEAIFALLLALAWWLSLGPAPRVFGRMLSLWSPYQLLYDVVPGFDGLRVPARFAMIVAFLLSVLGGLALARIERWRHGSLALMLMAVAFLIEARVRPFPVNSMSAERDYRAPEPRIRRPARASPIYQQLARTPPNAVVLELPFGEPGYDVRAVYYSTVHWRALVNGYSGFFPPHYSRLIAVLSAATRGDDLAWPLITEFGVTHVIIHHGAYRDDEGARFDAWLREHGAVETLRDGTDVLLEIPRQ